MALALEKLIKYGGVEETNNHNCTISKIENFCIPRGNMTGYHRYVNIGQVGTFGGVWRGYLSAR